MCFLLFVHFHIACSCFEGLSLVEDGTLPEKVMFRNVNSLPVTIPFHFRLNYLSASVLETFKSTKVGTVGIHLLYNVYSVIEALLHKPIYIICITYSRWFVFPRNKKTMRISLQTQTLWADLLKRKIMLSSRPKLSETWKICNREATVYTGLPCPVCYRAVAKIASVEIRETQLSGSTWHWWPLALSPPHSA